MQFPVPFSDWFLTSSDIGLLPLSRRRVGPGPHTPSKIIFSLPLYLPMYTTPSKIILAAPNIPPPYPV